LLPAADVKSLPAVEDLELTEIPGQTVLLISES
jgi:hypothetical protein